VCSSGEFAPREIRGKLPCSLSYRILQPLATQHPGEDNARPQIAQTPGPKVPDRLFRTFFRRTAKKPRTRLQAKCQEGATETTGDGVFRFVSFADERTAKDFAAAVSFVALLRRGVFGLARPRKKGRGRTSSASSCRPFLLLRVLLWRCLAGMIPTETTPPPKRTRRARLESLRVGGGTFPAFCLARGTRLWVPHQLPHVGFAALRRRRANPLVGRRGDQHTRGYNQCYARNHQDRRSRQTGRNRRRVSVRGTRPSGCRGTGSGNEPCRNGSGRGGTGASRAPTRILLPILQSDRLGRD